MEADVDRYDLDGAGDHILDLLILWRLRRIVRFCCICRAFAFLG